MKKQTRLMKVRTSLAKMLMGKRSISNAANTGRLFSDWTTNLSSVNSDVKMEGRTLLARSRNLVLNNPFARQYISMVKTNVVGPKGVMFQSRIRDGAKDKGATGQLDEYANSAVETAFKDWGKVGSCTMDGQLSWLDVQKLAIECVARDGDVFLRKIRGNAVRNKFKFALQIIESEYVDFEYTNPNARIDMGIEYDDWGKPVAYHMLTSHPSDSNVSYRKRVRVPAEEIIHLFMPTRGGQRRGIPWMVSAMSKMQMLDGYMEAELVAARSAASKMGFFTSEDGDSAGFDDTDASGNLIQDFEPATFQQLPAGTSFTAFDPQHPASAFGDFIKATLRSMASGLGVVYPSLANDLEGVNFSSIRHGALEERDQWRIMQNWLIEHLHEKVYDDWLLMALSFGGLPFPLTRLEKFNAAVWQPRGWAWVDPVKDATANRMMREDGIKSRQAAAAEMGRDFNDEVKEIQRENEMLLAAGIIMEGVNNDNQNG